MAQRTGHGQQPRDERQAAVTENMGGVEARVQETVDGVTSTVASAMEGFKQLQETVDGAKAAVEEILERVHVALQETVEGVKTTVERIEPAHIQQNPWIIVRTTAELIDPAHVNHNPWILMGSAILMGYLLGTLERHTASSPGPGESSAGRHERRGT
jgi:ElaB/YqjD/DUF883 family membrane-anchored ribosome-binding protein